LRIAEGRGHILCKRRLRSGKDLPQEVHKSAGELLVIQKRTNQIADYIRGRFSDASQPVKEKVVVDLLGQDARDDAAPTIAPTRQSRGECP
jgi:hypothetical protein